MDLSNPLVLRALAVNAAFLEGVLQGPADATPRAHGQDMGCTAKAASPAAVAEEAHEQAAVGERGRSHGCLLQRSEHGQRPEDSDVVAPRAVDGFRVTWPPVRGRTSDCANQILETLSTRSFGFAGLENVQHRCRHRNRRQKNVMVISHPAFSDRALVQNIVDEFAGGAGDRLPIVLPTPVGDVDVYPWTEGAPEPLVPPPRARGGHDAPPPPLPPQRQPIERKRKYTDKRGGRASRRRAAGCARPLSER